MQAPAPARVVTCPDGTRADGTALNSRGREVLRCVRLVPKAKPVVVQQAAATPVRAQPKAKPKAVAQAPVTRRLTRQPEPRVLPRHVAEVRRDADNVRVPKAYRSVWEDGRLNQQRQVQTLAGYRQMNLVWTSTVPRRLIDTTTGRDVTAREPLIYPYTDEVTQTREYGKVTLHRRGDAVIKRVQRTKWSKVSAKQKVTRKPSVAAKEIYVQVGMFSQNGNAERAGQRLVRTGLPARYGQYRKGSKSYRVVLAGPFGSDSDARRAVERARAAGFSDAFVRR